MAVRTIEIDITKPYGNREIGVAGENLATLIKIDCNGVLTSWPDASISVIIQRADGITYPAAVNLMPDDCGFVRYYISDADAAIPGDMKIEIVALQGEKIAKSCLLSFRVSESINITGDAPEPPKPPWTDEVIQSAEKARKAADDAEAVAGRAEAAITEIEAGETERREAETARQALYEEIKEEHETGAFTGGTGEPGAPGADGITPHIDTATGRWFIGDTDTGVPAQGPPGEPADITPEDLRLIFTDVLVPPSAWSEDATYPGWAYACEILLEGITEGMVPDVMFGMTEATSGNFAPCAEAYDGTLILYAKQAPAEPFVIPTIMAWR